MALKSEPKDILPFAILLHPPFRLNGYSGRNMSLSIFGDIDFNIFDSFIILENYFIDGQTRDVLNIFYKASI